MKINAYSFKDLRAAVDKDPTDENLEALALWCETYGNCWNGEEYDVSIPGEEPSGSRALRPVYRFEKEQTTPEELDRLEKEDEDGYERQFEIVGYRLV